MVKVIKSAVKCYKKKTKKTVGGKRKIYEYNQYLVPLKRSDNFQCSEDVLIIPKSEIEELAIANRSTLDELFDNLSADHSNIDAYERELAELEWKHNELSKSYKELVSKQSKTNKRIRTDGERIKTLEDENYAIKNQFKALSENYNALKTKYELESQKNKADQEENAQKDDIWSSLKSRLGSKKDGEGE
jgi:septal ring factor EnvC (AmiA/AmiB activator)